MEDTFLTIASASEGMYREKGSKFAAYARPVTDENEVKETIDLLRKKYFDARHHCYAYRLGANGERFRANDDGEPSGTAGKPILGQLTANNLTNTLVVVVRYFGGILLGTGGLVQAYKKAAADALANATVVSDIVTEVLEITFDYPDMNRVLKIMKDRDTECFDRNFNLRCSMKVKVRKSMKEDMQKQLSAIPNLKIDNAG